MGSSKGKYWKGCSVGGGMKHFCFHQCPSLVGLERIAFFILITLMSREQYCGCGYLYCTNS